MDTTTSHDDAPRDVVSMTTGPTTEASRDDPLQDDDVSMTTSPTIASGDNALNHRDFVIDMDDGNVDSMNGRVENDAGHLENDAGHVENDAGHVNAVNEISDNTDDSYDNVEVGSGAPAKAQTVNRAPTYAEMAAGSRPRPSTSPKRLFDGSTKPKPVIPKQSVAGPSTSVAGPSTSVAGPSISVAGPSTSAAFSSTLSSSPTRPRPSSSSTRTRPANIYSGAEEVISSDSDMESSNALLVQYDDRYSLNS